MTAEPHAPTDAVLRASADQLGQALAGAGIRLAVAESCTGGWLAKVLTDIPGSSHWFEAGFVTYSNDAKVGMLGISEQVLNEHGAVSEAVVVEMAAGARRKSGAEAAIAISGVAGPDGGTAEKPVGLVHFGCSVGDRAWARRVEFGGDREAVRRQSVAFAVFSLLDAIQRENP